ncbi:MAG TPA: LemA family protein [Candidatus Saccharimonadia bacterium]|nr:LemA family protein [Candidatus Saccharimonadia bacterium]
MDLLYVLIAVVVVAGVIAMAMYNGLVRLNVRSDEAWSDITVQLKRRYDLIPNLVKTVQGYASHEKTVFEKVTETRANALGAKTVEDTAKAENQIQTALKSLFAVSENYPDLKANQGFLDLQGQLEDTEDKIQASRRFYNGVVRDFNTKRKVFPTKVFAKMLGFKVDKPFFELDEAETKEVSEPVEVSFPQTDK